MNNDLTFSRPLATAMRLGEDALDKHRFLEKKVLLTGETEILSTENGKNCFIGSMLLLFRICRNLSIMLPAGCEALLNKSKLILDDKKYPSNIQFVKGKIEFKDYDAILNIGAQTRPDLPWTVINSNGWLVRISSGMHNISGECTQNNPIATLGAASLGVSEIFKRLIKLKEIRGRLLEGLTFSLDSYTSNETDYGLPLPSSIPIDMLLVGAGAIGNGIIYLLDLLPLFGRVLIVDSQKFQTENLGTCFLIGPSAIGTEKAFFTEKYLSKKLIVKGYPEDIQEFSKRLGQEIPYPKLILNGLDNIDARHAVQDFWPDIIIDGAIGDFMCQASRHPWGEDVACLRCLFQNKVELADEIASKATGLGIDRVKNELEQVTEDDVKSAPTHKQDWLCERIGKQICSVVQEGIAQKISKEKQNEGFEPSVPFVACFSASMVVSELMKSVLKFPTPLDPRFQFDILRGPAKGEKFSQQRRRDCICYTRKSNIDKFRSKQYC